MKTTFTEDYIMTDNITIYNNGYIVIELFLNGLYHMWEFHNHKLIEHNSWKINY